MIIEEYNENYFDEVNSIYYKGRQAELKGLCEEDEILSLLEDKKKFELFNSGKKFLFKSNDKINGFIVLNDSLISMLYIGEEYQRQGIARKLLKASYEFCKSEMYLNVAENNTSAIKLYESEGFQEINRFEVSFRNNKVFAIKMKKMKRRKSEKNLAINL